MTEGCSLLSQFIVQIQPPDFELEEDEILLVKAENGLLQRVYGPCVFRGEQGLILKLGANIFPVEMKGRDFLCGELQGDIEADPTSNTDYPVSYLRLTSTEPKLDWLITVRLAEGITASDVKQALRGGEEILGFFLPPPGQGEGGSTLKMQELGEGEFEVERVEQVTTKKEREAWVIHLKDGRQCWARGKTDIALKNGWQPDPSKPLTLRVANIQQQGNKTFLDCAFRYRMPVGSASASRQSPEHSSPKQQVMAEIDRLMNQVTRGRDKAKEWATTRGYSNRAQMPLDVLQQLRSHLEKHLNADAALLDDIPF